MLKPPRSLTIYIGIFGRTNVGKSTLVNYISGQDTSIVSKVAGTTTDVVYKIMELLPIGPITLVDTAGLDDTSLLSKERIERTNKVFELTDVAIIVTEPNIWTQYEQNIVAELTRRKTPFIVFVNNYKDEILSNSFINILKAYNNQHSKLLNESEYRESFLNEFKRILIDIIPEETLNLQPLTDNVIKKYQTAIMVVPIDLGAPKGRLILPQVQMIRAALDESAMVYIVKDTELQRCLDSLKNKPDIVICDSQVVKKVFDIIPKNVLFTTFSIIFTSNRADFKIMLQGIEALKNLKKDDRVLIAEACSHHASKDDIGRIKIPRWLSEHFGFDVKYDVCAGMDYPKDMKKYSLIIHCGGCMINKKQMISRLNYAVENNVPITNYGMVISFINNTLDRVIEPFTKS
ncbi:MAG: [FeFe] hydrogenase H-cluster maturation GTPase HydF [Endomicrobiaceae bacterium]|nr:[FeFe] hydrogenase H-cluster maturation GTPase HydF [Endomicrobiaceae bacterium]